MSGILKIRKNLSAPGVDVISGSVNFPILNNIALNKPTTSSNDGQGSVPSRANDGDSTNATYWDSVYPSWWKVDLQAEYNLNGIVVRNYVDGTRYYQYTVEGSLDDITYTNIATKSSVSPATDEGDIYSGLSVTARYLRVNMTFHSANPGAHIADFRAYPYV